MPSPRSRPNSFSFPPAAAAGRWAGFTLIELMVTLVILSILAALTLMGLAGVRRNAKIAKTKNTIRKIDAVIRPMYDSYRTRRVRLSGGGSRTISSLERLARLRKLMAAEMPDTWEEIRPSFDQNAAARRYARERIRLDRPGSRFQERNRATRPPTNFGPMYGSAESLFLILALGGYEPDALELFRADEIGDVDGDGAQEFHDAWGMPIMFIRWPFAYQPVTGPPLPRDSDPLDPIRVSEDYALTPLIYSGGPDGALYDPLGSESGYGIRSDAITPPWPDRIEAWLQSPALATVNWTWNTVEPADQMNQPGFVLDSAKARDNITNYDLLRK